MTLQKHKEWYSRASALRSELGSDPANLPLARRVWNVLGGSMGYDVRSGRRAVETFRLAAFKSDEGLVALVEALKELADDTGELPRGALIDPMLENLLRLRLRLADGRLREDIAWILECIEDDF